MTIGTDITVTENFDEMTATFTDGNGDQLFRVRLGMGNPNYERIKSLYDRIPSHVNDYLLGMANQAEVIIEWGLLPVPGQESLF